MNHQPHRLHFLDHARGFIILLVVLQHAVQPFANFWGGRLWFVPMANRSDTYDYIFMWTDSFIMQGLFLIAGMFVIPSLMHRGWLSFAKEKLTRLGLVFIGGVAIIAPMCGFPKYHEDYLTGYLDYWFNVFFFDKIQLASFWFLPFLLILTFFTATIWTFIPRLIVILGNTVKWMCLNPVKGFLVFAGASAFIITASDLYWGTPWWISPIPHLWVGRANMFYVYIFYFFIGVGFRQSALLDDHKFMQSFKESWPKWTLLMIAVSLTYVGYSVGYMFDGAIDTSHTLTSLFREGQIERAFEYIAENGLPIIIRTVLHGFTCSLQSIGVIVLMLAFTNKEMRFWTSLAACSYGIYVVHEPIQVWFDYILVHSGLPLFLFMLMSFGIGLTGAWQLTDKILRKLPFTRRVF